MFTKFSMLVVNADKVMGIGLKEWPSLVVLITSPLLACPLKINARTSHMSRVSPDTWPMHKGIGPDASAKRRERYLVDTE